MPAIADKSKHQAPKVKKKSGSTAKAQAKAKGKKAGNVIKSPKAKAATKAKTPKKAETIKGLSKLDKAWFKTGGPKHYGHVTVFIDRRNHRYRVKPEPGSRYEWAIRWGKTEEELQEQWEKIMTQVREYQKRT